MTNQSTRIKEKLAKLLRLQQSANANEAANAAAFLQKLCIEHGISSDEINPDYDPERDEPIHWIQGGVFGRVDHAEWNLLQGIARYFNGCTVKRDYEESEATADQPYDWRKRQSVIEVVATKGNKIQIELYYEYLLGVMNKLADEAKKEDLAKFTHSDPAFRRNFRKGFALTVWNRLREMKYEEERDGSKVTNSPGLVVQSKNKREYETAMSLYERRHPNVRRGPRGTYGGNGTSAGRQAGASAGLSRQMQTGCVKSLTGS